MKLKKSFLLTTILVLLVPSVVLADCQQAQTEDQKMMEVYMKYAMPNVNHEYFKKFVGSWNVETKMWMKPGAEPTLSETTAESKLIFGGRYLYTVYKGMYMEQPFEGIQIAGFDNFKNKYVTFWIDNMGTSFYLTSGNLDKSGKMMTETGVWPDPIAGEMKIKIITKSLTNNKFIYEMYSTGPDGKEFKMMENTATRKQ